MWHFLRNEFKQSQITTILSIFPSRQTETTGTEWSRFDNSQVNNLPVTGTSSNSSILTTDKVQPRHTGGQRAAQSYLKVFLLLAGQYRSLKHTHRRRQHTSQLSQKIREQIQKHRWIRRRLTLCLSRWSGGCDWKKVRQKHGGQQHRLKCHTSQKFDDS